MSILFAISLVCLVLAARLSGPLRILPLLIATPLLLSLVGTILMREFGLTVGGALFSSGALLVLCIGLPLAALRIVDARAQTVAREKRLRLEALRRETDL